MVSGKYSALSGALAKEQALNNIANNLANVNTTGFKRDRVSFESVLRGINQRGAAKGINYARIGAIGPDLSPGALRVTDRELDVAIEGEGFFKIQRANDTLYTRSGQFTLDEDGMLKTQDGSNVLGIGNQAIQFDPLAGNHITIGPDGQISIDGQATGSQLQVFTIQDPQQLEKVGDSMFRLKQGANDQPAADSRILQGSLETSNVNMMEEMVAMINGQRLFEAHHKALQSYSALGEKLDELGTVG
jgi:flagellar basal-body rod protein FlgF